MDQAVSMEFLSKLPVFKKGSPELIKSIYEDSQVCDFMPNFEVLKEGDLPGEEGYVILEGSVDVFIGGEHITALSRGDVFGEYAPIFRQKRSATIVARDHLKCMILNKRSLIRLIGHGVGLNQIVFKRMAENKKKNRGEFGA